MQRNKEPKGMIRVDEYIWPYLYIVLILSLSLLGERCQAQTTCVETWRLEKACQELMLMDSLVKDTSAKDSVISELKELNETRLSEIDSYRKINHEKSIQLGLSQSTTDNLMKENLIWKSQVKRLRRQRNLIIGIGGGGIIAGLLLL